MEDKYNVIQYLIESDELCIIVQIATEDGYLFPIQLDINYLVDKPNNHIRAMANRILKYCDYDIQYLDYIEKVNKYHNLTYDITDNSIIYNNVGNIIYNKHSISINNIEYFKVGWSGGWHYDEDTILLSVKDINPAQQYLWPLFYSDLIDYLCKYMNINVSKIILFYIGEFLIFNCDYYMWRMSKMKEENIQVDQDIHIPSWNDIENNIEQTTKSNEDYTDKEIIVSFISDKI